MFKLISVQGNFRYEENFTASEKDTAVAIAADRLASGRYSFVGVLDCTLARRRVGNVQPTDPDAGRLEPVALPTTLRVVSEASWLPLKARKLPRVRVAPAAKAAPVVVTAEAFDLPAKPRRVSKRQRAFPEAVSREVVVS